MMCSLMGWMSFVRREEKRFHMPFFTVLPFNFCHLNSLASHCDGGAAAVAAAGALPRRLFNTLVKWFFFTNLAHNNHVG